MESQQKKKIIDERGKFYELKILSAGECFGEEEILMKRNSLFYRIYRVVCISDQATVYAIPKKQMIRLL